MTRHVFPYVRIRARLRGDCPVCGKTTTRTCVFEHTVNPFNRRADGEPKTQDEVRDDVTAEANTWVPDFTHVACSVAS